MSDEPPAKKAKVEKPILHSYWRSSCSWRVRIALAYKNIDYDYEAVNLLKGEQKANKHIQRNVMAQVPALIVENAVLGQSLAMLEYLEEKFPDPPLLPSDPLERAKVREICNIIASGIQPIQNLVVLNKVAADFGEEHKIPWGNFWITKGFEALELVLAKTANKYCFGDKFTMADCCLVPQVYNAQRFAVDLSRFPLISRIYIELEKMKAVKDSSPDQMPDAVK
ncbi:putative maleylacetoacetate isomerase 2 [Diplonema papillatum]|nr:putative maleylacetoacetate isomerase 2 [Diplonema papillatum]